jgi:hypothetical protein
MSGEEMKIAVTTDFSKVKAIAMEYKAMLI